MQNLIRNILLFILFISISFCSKNKIKVDTLFYNGTIYTVDSAFSICNAFVIKDGKIVDLGQMEKLMERYSPANKVDLDGKYVYPGFIDAHCHFYNYGIGLQEASLVGTKSFKEVVDKMVEHSKFSEKKPWILGRGWDQNDWENKKFPNRIILDSLFPDKPVFMMRVDGHAALVNSKALNLAGISYNTKIQGGDVIIENGEPSGVLIDNAIELVRKVIPLPNNEDNLKALLDAERNCFAVGLTTVDDAGLDKEIIFQIKDLHASGKLKMRIYAMASSTDPNFNYFFKKGKIKTDRLNVRSFKFYADGALGSRGACLMHDYEDQKGWKGFLLSDENYFREKAKLMLKFGFQMNTHCIGDSSDRLITDIYFQTLQAQLKEEKIAENFRWRIEHAQVVNDEDLKKFKYFIPSVQPTHATSDMYWAADRLGYRIKNAYAYKNLLDVSKVIALGTDFPVEDISPVKTFYAAVIRKDLNGFPKNGFQIENSLSREEALKGITIWAAYSNFEENEKGSIEIGKFADFVVIDQDLLKVAPEKIIKSKVLYTFINGEKVYSLK